MKNYFVAMIFSMSVAFSATVPLEKIVTTEIAIGEWAVFDFPFKITKAIPTSFKSKYSVEQVTDDAEKISGGSDYLDEKLPPIRKKGAKGNKTRKTKPINIKISSHTVSVYPKKYGETNFLIWGHKSYPIMMKIKVVKRKKGATYLSFKDYEEASREASVLEKTSHEKAIVILIKHLYKRSLPKGFRSRTSGKSYRNGKIRMRLVRSIVGKGYRGDEWIVKNTYKVTKKLYEEIFYNDGIYAVSLENNILKPGESTRLFVVRRAN